MATILVVDDRRDNREFLVTLLQYSGHRLLEAADGAEGLDLVRREQPDLAIVDLVMPIIDGYEFVRQLRADPSIAHTRVIFYTATYLQSEAWTLAQAGGVFHVITKPAEPETILSRVTEALGLTVTPTPSFSAEDFDREHLRTVADKLHKQIEALEHEVTERTLAQAQLEQEAQVSAALARMGQELIASLDTPKLLQRFCQLTTEVLEAEITQTLLWQSKENAYIPVASYGETPEQRALNQVLKIPCGTQLGFPPQLKQETVLEAAREDPQHRLLAGLVQQHGARVGLFIALTHGEELIGVQAVYCNHLEHFLSQHTRIARGISHIASLAIAHSTLLQELEQANRLKSDFLAAMSHELRTPIHVIMGYAELLLDGAYGSLVDKQAEKLQRIEKNAWELHELIAATLDVSRLEAERLSVEVEEISLHRLINELASEATRLLEEKPGVAMLWQVGSSFPPFHTDRMKLKIILKNLLTNAVKFTERGSITISVLPRDAGMEFCVADTGIGVAPEFLPEMFEMFRQGDSSTTRRYGGVGLGLYLVRRLLELLGGRVTVESTLGQGTKFCVWVPEKPQEAELSNTPPE